MEQRVSLITLGVRDVASAKAFYERLGWKCGNDHPEVAFFQLGGTIFGLWNADMLADDAKLPRERSAYSGVALAYNGRDKEEVDRVFGQAVEAGAKALKPPHETFWGGYSGYFSDPDGHVWEVAWNPQWRIADDGSVHLQ